jgi:transcriptional regulator with XRE-family HTH domain
MDYCQYSRLMVTSLGHCWKKEGTLVMTDVRTLLALNMKKYRKILGLSQAALAEKANCSTTFIGNIEISKRFPSAQYLNRIVKVLGVKPADLFAEGSDSKTVPQFTNHQKRKVQLERDVLKAVSKVFNDSDL